MPRSTPPWPNGTASTSWRRKKRSRRFPRPLAKPTSWARMSDSRSSCSAGTAWTRRAGRWSSSARSTAAIGTSSSPGCAVPPNQPVQPNRTPITDGSHSRSRLTRTGQRPPTDRTAAAGSSDQPKPPELDGQVVRIAGRGHRGLQRHHPVTDERDEVLVKRLHPVIAAFCDQVGDLVGLLGVDDRFGDPAGVDAHLHRHAPPFAIRPRDEPLAEDAAERARQGEPDLLLLMRREEIDDPVHRLL